MNGGRFLMATTLLCVGCAGLPPKQEPVQLPSAAPLDGVTASGGAWPALSRSDSRPVDRTGRSLVPDPGHGPCPL